jgi:hypothetical protein
VSDHEGSLLKKSGGQGPPAKRWIELSANSLSEHFTNIYLIGNGNTIFLFNPLKIG